MDRFSSDAAAIRLLRAQHGYALVTQLVELGLTLEQIGLRVRKGLFRRVTRGVIALVDPEHTPIAMAMRGVLVGGGHAVASLWTAAALHDLEAPRSGQTHVVVEHGRSRGPVAGVFVHRTRYLPPEHVVKIGGLPVTSIARTIVDCASALGRWEALRMLDSCSATRTLWRSIHLTADELSNGRAGVRAIAEATAADGDARMRSVLERRAHDELRMRGVADGEWNVAISDTRGRVREVDLCYRRQRLIVELDGLRFHRTAQRQRRDRATDRRLQLDGWTILRFTWRDVVERPGEMAHEIARALEAR